MPWLDVFNLVPVPLWLIGKDGVLWLGNRAWHQLTSADCQPALRTGTGWLAALHEEDRGRTVAAFRAAAAERTGVDVDVRMRSPEGYRVWSLSGAAISAAAGGVRMFVGAASDRTAAQEAERRLRDLNARLVAAQEAERARIGRELHDDVAQLIAVLAAKLDAAEQTRPFLASRVRGLLADARGLVRELTSGIHALSHAVHPPKLRLLGLVPTLRALCAELTTTRMPVHFAANDALQPVAADAELCVFRVAQEALRNALKHSGASRIDVRLQSAPAAMSLSVADDGTGFNPAAARDAGLGLLMMRERVELVGGRLRISSEAGSGTVVEVIVPIPARNGPS
jgi:signal transduction histidine kinase